MLSAPHVLETLPQDREIERLREKVGRSNFIGTADRLLIIHRRHHHDRRVLSARLRAQPCTCLEPVHSGHPHVQQDDVGLDALGDLACVEAVPGLFYGPEVRFEGRPDEAPSRPVVFSNEHSPVRQVVGVVGRQLEFSPQPLILPWAWFPSYQSAYQTQTEAVSVSHSIQAG